MVKLMQLGETERLLSVDPEPRSRGAVLLASDRRGDYLVVAQSGRLLRRGIFYLTDEKIHSSSLYKAVNKEGVFVGSFEVARVPLAAAAEAVRRLGGAQNHIFLVGTPQCWNTMPLN